MRTFIPLGALAVLLAGCQSPLVTPDVIAKLTRLGNKKEVLAVLRQEPFDPNQPTRDNDYVLHIAILHGDPDIVEAILDKKARVDVKYGPNKDTALGLAAKGGTVKIVRALLAHGANTSKRDGKGNLAIAFAPTVEIASLLATSADALAKPNKTGGLVVDNAITAKRYEVVKTLLDMGGASALRGHGAAQLELAAANNDTKLIDLLVENGAQVNQPHRSERGKEEVVTYPVTVAAAHHGYEAVQDLIAKGADVRGVGYRGWTALHEAAAVGDIQMADLLIREGAAIDAKDALGRTPLHLAVLGDARSGLLASSDDSDQKADTGSLPMIQLLIKNGASVNARDAHGWTPLFRAVTLDDRPVISELLQSGADSNLRDLDGRSIEQAASGLERGTALSMLHKGVALR